MEKLLTEQIALFRFSVISPLLHQRNKNRGDQEARIRSLTEQYWEIPGTTRTSLSRSTILSWLKLYERSGEKLTALEPRQRKDKGYSRILDTETQAALIALRKDNLGLSLPVLIKLAKNRGILRKDASVAKDSLYRLFKRHGLDKEIKQPEDRRKFETELVNDLWQSDAMHGPRVVQDGTLRKAYLFAVIDDHSRLITNARFYLQENIDCFRDCLITALERRGLPRRLYVDNGSSFRSHALKYACAHLGIALLHSRPYIPQGRGKIERFFLTVRTQFLPLLPEAISLEELNRQLAIWLEQEYHARKHSAIDQTPLARYLSQVDSLRRAPKDLHDYFRTPVKRKVDKDRTVALLGRLYEAPVGLMGKTVTLLYHAHDLNRIEIYDDGKSAGFLTPLDMGINSKVQRQSHVRPELVPAQTDLPAAQMPQPKSGSLFGEAL